MGKNRGGYTLIEVMIFLAVSGAIFASAVLLVSGQQGRTQFQQSMRDLNSKIQNSISEVKTGFFLTGGDAQCTVDPNTFNITLSNPGTSEQGSNEQCIYLGKAFQAIDGEEKIYIYNVVGSRLYKPSASSNATATAEKFKDTNPQPIFPTDTGSIDLTEEYDITYGSTVSSSKVLNGGSMSDSDLVGFYQSLEDEVGNKIDIDSDTDLETVNGTQSIFTLGYSQSPGAPRDQMIRTCIRGANPSCSNFVVQRWELCIQSQTSEQSAKITVTTTVAGVGTQLEIMGGSDCT